MNDAGLHRGERTLLAAIVLAGTVIVGVAPGCGGGQKGPPPRAVFSISVQVEEASSGEGIPKAPVAIDGRTVGYTDAAGNFAAKLNERPGEEIEVEVAELDGYRFVGERSMTDTLDIKPGLDGERNPVPVLLQTQVRSIRKPYFLWLRARCDEETLAPEDCRGLPVELDGEVVGRTDWAGVAHVSVQRKPQSTATVSVETPSTPEQEGPTFEPTDPSFDVEFGLNSQVHLVDARFRDPSVDEEPDWQPPPNRTSGGGGQPAQKPSGAETGGESESALLGVPDDDQHSGSGGEPTSEARGGESGGGSQGASNSTDDSSDDREIDLF